MDTHLHHDTHTEKHLKSSDLLRDVVIGMSDGLTVPFALAAGLSGAVDKSSIIVIAGIAEIAAGSIAMGLGGYLAGKTEQDHYRSEVKREYDEVENLRHKEIDKDRWVDFMMKYELGLEKPDPKRATKSALNIGISYAAGGIIPLSPYFFIESSAEALKVSAVATLLCLFIFGFFKSKMTGVNPFWGALKVMLIGAVAAAAAFGVAKLFDGH